MPKFLCLHTIPPNSVSPQQLNEIAQAGQRDAVIRGYRSFINLSEGKVACILEGPTRQSCADWFDKMGLGYDSICEVEYEGDRGNMRNVASSEMATAS